MKLVHRWSSKQNGMSLIETLLALAVLAIGMLGLAGLLLLSTKANNSSYSKQLATQIVYNMFDRVRANYQAAIDGDYNVSNISSTGAPSAVSSPSVDCSSSSCNAQQMASYDTWYWLTKMVTQLPSGSGSITTAPTGTVGNTLVTITVQWDDSPAQNQLGSIGSNSTANPTYATLTIQSQL